MDFTYFLRGLVLGFSIAAPVGPIGVLCIRRSLAQGRTAGFITGLGAATADSLYGAVAAFGLTFVSTFLVEQQTWLRTLGGLFLLYLGARTFLASPASQAAEANSTTLAGAYGSTLILTLTNPLTILSFAAVFAGLGLSSAAGTYTTAALTVAGVFTGSASWWLLLSLAVSLLRNRVGPETLRWVNRVSGVVIAIFGLAALSVLFW